ncbi:MAG: hypothetical protein JST92_02880 [Deltaproteobacteria bacterium]|nr:hypothetical protein [Deltaproteobacteria bacterium]
MTAAYRLVTFTPDPIRETRVAIGALVATDLEVTLIESLLPSAEHLGGPQAQALVKLSLESLRQARNFKAHTGFLGPQVLLGPATDLPEHVDSPNEWVRDHVLPGAATQVDEGT